MREFISGFFVGAAVGMLLYTFVLTTENRGIEIDRVVTSREVEYMAAWSCRCDTCCRELDRIEAEWDR